MLLLCALALVAAGPDDPAPVAVLVHPVARGERIERGDFALEARPPAAARTALGIDEAAGMEAVRDLPAGAVVRRGDVIRPQLVRRGEPVAIRVVQGRLAITASGRALGSGGQGDLVRVVVNSTSRTLDAVVEGSGSVRITTP